MDKIIEGIKDRGEVSSSDKWNVEALYPSLEAWYQEMREVCRPDEKPHWPAIAAFKGKLGSGVSTIKEFLVKSFELDRKLSKLYTYVHMRFDEDLANEENKKAYTLLTTLYHDFVFELSWAEPEILSIADETIETYLKDEGLREYHFHLERMIRLKPHTLSAEKEELMAQAGFALGSVGKSFGAFNNADLKFPPAIDCDGNENEMTHAKYMLYMRGSDRVLRENAFKSLHNTFEGFENTLGEMTNGHVQNVLFSSRARKFDSCLSSALFPNLIDTSVYTNLVETVRENLPVLHEYMGVRKKALGVDKLHMYDLYVPMVENADFKYDYETAESMVIESVKPLGVEYQGILHKGLKQDRWVDRYENQRKRSGAYSTGCFDSMPYILMNFQGTFSDLTTLAHEAGHSMHSYMSHKHQPYQYSHYPIFLAEVASTFNEELMFHHLMQQDLSKEQKAFLINQKIEDIRATFFRQTMLAEFELHIHKLAEESVPLTPGLLKEYYHGLNVDYFGPDVEIDRDIDIEWARIPHFYNHFYVYQYATGISAAHGLFEKVMEEGDKAKEGYLNFLCSGSSRFPLDLLEDAGVNMRHRSPIEATIKQFDRLSKELAGLL